MNPMHYQHGLDALPFFAGAFAAFLFPIIILAAIWTLAIKGYALWHAARNGQKWWFVALLVINTFGILELIYIFGFRTDRQAKVAAAPAAPGSEEA